MGGPKVRLNLFFGHKLSTKSWMNVSVLFIWKVNMVRLNLFFGHKRSTKSWMNVSVLYIWKVNIGGQKHAKLFNEEELAECLYFLDLKQ